MNGSLVHHQAADEVHIAAQAVELRDDHRGLVLLGQLHRGGQLRPLLERIGAFAGLDLAEGLDQIVTLGLGEGGNRRLLGVEADAGLALLVGLGQAGVGDGGHHRFKFPRLITLLCPLYCHDRTNKARRCGVRHRTLAP